MRMLAVSGGALVLSCLAPNPAPEAPKPASTAPSGPNLPGFQVSSNCSSDKAAAEAHAQKYGAAEHHDLASSDGGPPVSGRLPPEEIQRLVRAHYGVFRACYEGGLKRNGKLQGVVMTKFVIDRQGSVSKVSLDCTTMPDELAVTCIVNGYRDLKFPQPESGIVTVVYPIMFSPD